jgi:hypothetical protein
MKCQFGYRKVRYRGIAKNGAQSLRCSRSPTYSLPVGHSRRSMNISSAQLSSARVRNQEPERDFC